MFNIIIEMFMTLIAIRYSPHGMIFFDQFNMTPMVLGWGCTGMVLWRNITIFLILNSYAECICIHTNNTYIYIHVTDHLDSWLPRVFLCPRNEPKMTLLVPSELKIFDTVPASVSLSDFISDFRGEKTLKKPSTSAVFPQLFGWKRV